MLHSFLHSDPGYRNIYESVRGIFFFGTPHQGLDVKDFREMIRRQAEEGVDNYELEQLLDRLDVDSEFLHDQRESCRPMWELFTGQVCSFHEVEKTDTVVCIHRAQDAVSIQKVLILI